MSEAVSNGVKERPCAGIVGGSIAGCATAIALDRAGWEVTLFERSPGRLMDRGAGIAMAPAAFDDFIERGLLDADTPALGFDHFEQFWRSEEHSPYGLCPAPQSLPFRTLNWGELYRCLYDRLPAGCYRGGATVADVGQHETDGAVLTLADGSEHRFDLIVCADGYRSRGRRQLFPAAALDYAGYIGWRGVLPESALDDITPLAHAMCGLAWHDTFGTCYFVPGSGSKTEPGERLVNWVLYRQVAEADLADYMTDRHGNACCGTVPPDRMSDERLGELRAFADQRLPPYFADICRRSEGSFIQAIYDVQVPGYRRGRVCLAGDAGTMSLPHAASGALKAIGDAADLADALESAADIDAALEAWSVKRRDHALRLHHFARHIAHECVYSMPDLAQMDARTYTRWFRAANGMSASGWQS